MSEMCRITELCCFRCLSWFAKENAAECAFCGDWKCTECGSCLCSLSISEKRIAIAYMMGYEKALEKLTGVRYDMKRHARILAEIGANV